MGVRFAAGTGGALSALALVLLAMPSGFAAELPPDVEADRHFVKAERQFGEGDYQGAAATLGKILALQSEHGFEVPASFWFKHALALLKAGDLDRAERSATRYIRMEGRAGEHYGEALKMFDRIEQGRAVLAPGRVFRDPLQSGGEGPQMVVLPAGSFRMGCLSDGRDCRDDEKPVRGVRIVRPIAVSVHEVTFEDYDRFTRATGARKANDGRWGRGLRPVINVSWRDAKAYAAWLSSQTGAEYRLLSESEWEYAARAGTSTRYSWGDGIGAGRANCRGCGGLRGDGQPELVWGHEPNGFGLHNMHGNVQEWVEDCWNGSYRGAPANGEAWVRGDCSRRVSRGGSWADGPGSLRSAARNGSPAVFRVSNIGIRVARTLAP